MTFGERIRELRHERGWTLRTLAAKVEVGFTYLSRVENGRLNFGDYPSNELIQRLADTFKISSDELMLLAERVPDRIRKRILQKPELFSLLADCRDDLLDRLLIQLRRAVPKKAAVRARKKRSS